MLDMKTASVRDVQHHLSKVLAWVEKGEEVQITRPNKPVAKSSLRRLKERASLCQLLRRARV